MPLKKKKKVVKKPVAKKKPVVRKKAKPVKKPAKKKPAILGKITHYFPQVQAAVIKLKGTLKVGETIKIKGHTTDLLQQVTSMQMDRVPVDSAKKGQEIGVQVNTRVRQHDVVTKVS